MSDSQKKCTCYFSVFSRTFGICKCSANGGSENSPTSHEEAILGATIHPTVEAITTKKPNSPPLFMFIFSMPLNGQQFDPLDEAKIIKDTISSNKKCIRFEQLWGNFTNIDRHLEEKAPLILHFTGHGDNGSIVFESDVSAPSVLTKDAFTTLMNSKSTSSIELAFVASCSSEVVGHAFVEAGVKQVIASCGKVSDGVAGNFVKYFYQELFKGESIEVSFKKAGKLIEFVLFMQYLYLFNVC